MSKRSEGVAGSLDGNPPNHRNAVSMKLLGGSKGASNPHPLCPVSGHSFPQATCDILELNAVVSSMNKFGLKLIGKEKKKLPSGGSFS